MAYTIKLPKILCLLFTISKKAKDNRFYNTTNLAEYANNDKPELVRTRRDKTDYKYFDDTKAGGLRGNFSTALTFKGIIKIGNQYSPYYGFSKNDRLINAYRKGDLIITEDDKTAHTQDSKLADLLISEKKAFKIRENQAHIKSYLIKHKDFPLKRDNDYANNGVLKSDNNQYFIRILFNTFVSDNILEYNMYSYFEGAKVKRLNMHALFVIPSEEESWNDFYVIDSKDLLTECPLLLYFDKNAKRFLDINGKIYPSYGLNDAINTLSDQNGNVKERLDFNWAEKKESLVVDFVNTRFEYELNEYFVFLTNYLNGVQEFNIGKLRIVKHRYLSSPGPDVILEFSGGTQQKLELEHKWNNYVLHKHYQSSAWKNVWLYADEEWDFDNIKNVFGKYVSKFQDNIPTVFLCTDKRTKQKQAYKVDWTSLKYEKLVIVE